MALQRITDAGDRSLILTPVRHQHAPNSLRSAQDACPARVGRVVALDHPYDGIPQPSVLRALQNVAEVVQRRSHPDLNSVRTW